MLGTYSLPQRCAFFSQLPLHSGDHSLGQLEATSTVQPCFDPVIKRVKGARASSPHL